MTMVEIMARAIALSFGDDYGSIPADKREWTARRGDFEGRFRDVNEAYRCDYDDMAIAALKAMREPTERMCNNVALQHISVGSGSDWLIAVEANAVWRAMIDQAIAEAETK